MSEVICVTGISGSGSKDFCQNYVDSTKKTAKIISIGDLIYEYLQKNTPKPVPKYILNANPGTLESCRDRAFEQAINDINKQDHDVYLVDTHAQFFWNGVFINGHNCRHVNRLGADMFITIIDKVSSIRDNQMNTAQGTYQKHTDCELLLWQNEEVNFTKIWAEMSEQPHYIFPRLQETYVVDNLLQNAFLLYYSMPMTDADEEANNMISNFKEALVEIGKDIQGYKKPTPIVDPRTIDLINDNVSEDAVLLNERHTNERDLAWYIGEVTGVVAYYPKNAAVSMGVSHEVMRATEQGKYVGVIYPNPRRSPFAHISTGLYSSEDQFFRDFKFEMEEMVKLYERK